MNYAVILAGGTGTRLWPFSRELEPKQFLKIIGEKSLLQATIRQLDNLIAPENIYIVTNSAYIHELKKQLSGFSIPDENIILEPQGKNTAPAIGLCARLISMVDKDAVLVVLPSDHHIRGINGFRRSLLKAIACAAENFLVTVGIKPMAPSSGYGYIKLKSKTRGRKKSWYPVERFLEKPDPEKAKKYFKDKRFFWNSGIFAWKASVFMKEMKSFLPQLHSHLEEIRSKDDISRVWPKIRPVSVDYGVLEHSGSLALVPADFEWSDLGSWDALENIFPKDAKGNVLQADCLVSDSSGLCIYSMGKRLLSAIGLKDMVIVDTPDALLLCDKYRTEEVKKIVERLKLSKRKECLVHASEKRYWGSYTVLYSEKGFKIKIIEIEPGKKISLQRHRKRAEHWVVVSGSAKVTRAGKIEFVQSNQSIYIPKGIKHRLENPNTSVLKIVEVQTGSYLEEDDIERFSD